MALFFRKAFNFNGVFFSDQGISYINLNNTVKNKNYTTTVGTSFTFIVKVDAYPQPVHYEWFHDETEIVNDTKHSVFFSQKEAMFKIPNVNIRDNGIYMLRATNSKLEETLNFTLNVLGKSHYLLIMKIFLALLLTKKEN